MKPSASLHKLKSDTKGFTLAELLMVVAIVAILAAIAIPSVVAIQRNMHFTELERAAAQIAQAAQNQMTAKKVAGTWYDLLGSTTYNYKGQKAKNLPSSVSATEAGDIYYFTADQARKNGALPRNSIDEEVWNGDYIIEYNRSTATVCGVFFSDGRSGIFDNSAMVGTPAQSYYESSTSNAMRERTPRIDNDPPVGYYGGTPAGATSAIALEKPLIWVTDEGKLCVENPNLENTSSWAQNSVLKLTITKFEDDGTETLINFVFDNLQAVNGGVTAMTLTTKDGAPLMGSVSASGVIALTGDEDSIFAFDLNAALDLMRNSGDPDFVAIADSFDIEDNLRVDAEVRTANGEKYGLPVTATAYIAFPKVLPKVTLYVTDPGYKQSSSGATPSGTYTDPKVEQITSGGTVIDKTKDALEIQEVSSTSATLIAQNQGAGYQAYRGKSLLMEDYDPTITALRATVGSYNAHTYQVWELYVNGVKVGYLSNETWVWASRGGGLDYSPLASHIYGFYDGNGRTDTRTTLDVNPRGLDVACANVGISADENDSYIVHVRTAPKTAEIGSYFMDNGNSMKNRFEKAIGGNGVGTVSARTNGNWADLRTVRDAVESEFGCSSAVGLWTATTTLDSGISGFPYQGNQLTLRIYYAITPAVGMAGASHESTNASLWMTIGNNNWAATPEAKVFQPRADDGLAPYVLQYGQTDTQSTNADFRLAYTQDPLFYRALFYYNSAGVLQTAKTQYVPHTQEMSNYLSSGVGTNFVYWTTADTYTAMSGNNRVACAAGAAVGSTFYSASDGNKLLKWGRVELKALLATVGLAYYENYGSSYGFYGYNSAGDTTLDFNTLQGNGVDILNWGYYVLVPQSVDGITLVPNTSTGALAKAAGVAAVDTEGYVYDCYQFSSPAAVKTLGTGGLIAGTSISLAMNGTTVTSATYTFNHNFAKALAPGSSAASTWGTASRPYYVRHIDQFIGRVNSTAQTANMSKNFIQERHIAFTGDTAATQPVYQNTAFSGTYDGGGNEIRNYRAGAHGSDELIGGLFYSTSGATIRNSTLVELQQSTWGYSLSGTLATRYVKFGYFAGYAQNSTFDNCVVVGSKGTHTDDADYDVYITYGATNGWQSLYIRPCIGGIVGETEGSTLKDCLVSNLKMKGTRTTSGVLSTRYMAGGLIGRASSSTTIVADQRTTFVEDTTISIDISRWLTDSFSGALVGCAPATNTVTWPTNPGTRYTQVYNQIDAGYYGTGDYFGGTFSD